MRYDKPNKVIGEKTFHDLEAEFLELSTNLKVQDVDILEFINQAVLKSGSYRILGKKSLESARFEDGLR